MTTLPEILRSVCTDIGVDPAALRAGARHRRESLARQVACLVARRGGASYHEIAAAFGGAHTTAMYGVRMARTRLAVIAIADRLFPPLDGLGAAVEALESAHRRGLADAVKVCEREAEGRFRHAQAPYLACAAAIRKLMNLSTNTNISVDTQ